MRHLFYKLIFAATLVFAALLLPRNAWAIDLTVTCAASGPCTISPSGQPLFNETNWVPGDNVTRNIIVINQDSAQSCNLTVDTNNETQNPSNFASQLTTSIDQSTTNYFNGTFSGLFASGPISLGSVPASSSLIYNWNAAFNSTSGNEFQNAQTVFNFDLAFVCDGAVTPPSGGGVAGLSAAGAPVCNSTTPSTAPILSVVSAGPNTAGLSWTAVNPVTHYMIRYGLVPGVYIYGAPNVGNVTSYTVSALSGGTTYYFQVAGVNNCAPGPWSNQVSNRPTGGVLPQQPAPGFIETTLGVTAEATSSATPSATPVGQVEGAGACSDVYYPWWLPLLIELILLAVYFWIIYRRKLRRQLWWLMPALVAILSQIVHEILGCNCATGRWCPWYWLFNLIILLALAGAYYYKTRGKTS